MAAGYCACVYDGSDSMADICKLNKPNASTTEHNMRYGRTALTSFCMGVGLVCMHIMQDIISMMQKMGFASNHGVWCISEVII